MPIKAEEYLFELIHSLTQGEKKSFKLFANYYSSGEKQYLQLFELIDRQKQYNKQAIKEILRKKKISTPLPRLKNYLLELILKSQRFHHSGKTVDMQLRDLFTDSEFCHRKGLMNLRDKQLKKAETIAHDNEKYEAGLTIIDKKISFAHFSLLTINMFDDHKIIRQNIAKKNEYLFLVFKAGQLLMKDDVRDERLKNDWDTLIQNQLMDKSKAPGGFEESYFYNWIWSIYHSRMGDFEKCLYYQELTTEKIESNPKMLKEKYIIYMNSLNGLIAANSQLKNTAKAQESMNKLMKMQEWELSSREINELNNVITMGYANLVVAFLRTNQFTELVRVADQADFFVKTNKSDSYSKSALYAQLTISDFVRGNYEKSLFWNNFVLNESVKSLPEEVYLTGRVLNLILHYELGHTDLLFYKLRSTYRFLYKKKRLYKFENVILYFIRNKLPKINSPKEQIEFFKELKHELEKITKDVYEAKALMDFDFISWIESKIQNRTFADILKERFTKKY